MYPPKNQRFKLCAAAHTQKKHRSKPPAAPAPAGKRKLVVKKEKMDGNALFCISLISTAMVFTLLGVFVVRGGKNAPQRTRAPLALTPPKPNWQDFHTLLRLVDGTVAFLQPFIMLIAIILACLLNYCKQYLPYAGFFFALDWGVRFVVPYFFGAPCYDVLLRKDPPADAELAAERARLHRKVSMRVVACVKVTEYSNSQMEKFSRVSYRKIHTTGMELKHNLMDLYIMESSGMIN